MKYLDDIYSYSAESIANQNLTLFLNDKDAFKKIKDICYKPVVAMVMYKDAVCSGYQPLIDAMKIALEGSVEDVKLRLNQ